MFCYGYPCGYGYPLWLSLSLCYAMIIGIANVYVNYICDGDVQPSSFAIVLVTTRLTVLVFISYLSLSCWLFEALLLLCFDFLALCRG